MLRAGSECYSLPLKTADYRGQKFFSHPRGIGGRNGRWVSSRRGDGVRKRGSRSALEGWSGWLDSDREAAKDLREDDERLGCTPRGTARPAMTDSSHNTHPRQSPRQGISVRAPTRIPYTK